MSHMNLQCDLRRLGVQVSKQNLLSLADIYRSPSNLHMGVWREGGKEGREGEREGGREGEREGEREKGGGREREEGRGKRD